MRQVLAYLILWMMLAAAQAAEPTNAVKAMPLEELVSIALESNPRLLAVQTHWNAVKNRPARAGALPNPKFTFRGMDKADGGEFPDTNEKRYEVEQSFLWFGKRALQRQAAEKEVQAMRFEYETETRDTILEVKETYYELCGQQRILAITRAEANVLQHLEQLAESVRDDRLSGQQDLLKAQAETTLLIPRLVELEAQTGALKSRLNILLGRAADEPLEVAPPAGFPDIETDLPSLRSLADEHRPEIARAGADLDRSQIERRLRAKERYPDYHLGAEYRTFESEDPNQALFKIGIDLPIWEGKNRAGVREAEEMVVSSRTALEAARRQADLDVQQSLISVKSARQTLDLYRNTLLPQAQSRFSSSEAGYREGSATFQDLLESERFLLNARIMAATAEINLGKQLARLERALGTELNPAPPQRPSPPP